MQMPKDTEPLMQRCRQILSSTLPLFCKIIASKEGPAFADSGNTVMKVCRRYVTPIPYPEACQSCYLNLASGKVDPQH